MGRKWLPAELLAFIGIIADAHGLGSGCLPLAI
jgi:hypothetical protein